MNLRKASDLRKNLDLRKNYRLDMAFEDRRFAFDWTRPRLTPSPKMHAGRHGKTLPTVQSFFTRQSLELPSAEFAHQEDCISILDTCEHILANKAISSKVARMVAPALLSEEPHI